MSGLPAAFRVESIRDALSSASPVVSWKTLALLLALINLKNLPFFWHVSVLDIIACATVLSSN